MSFGLSNDFEAVMFWAAAVAEGVPEPYARLLLFLEDCEEAHSRCLSDQKKRGASYRQLAAIGLPWA